MRNKINVVFDAFFSFQKKRGLEEYTLMISVWSSVNGRVKDVNYPIVIHGTNPSRMSIEGMNKFKDFVDKSEYTKGVPMGDVNYKVKKYHSYLVATHATIQSEYN
ncbi:hypothetical protein AM24_006 [Acinetobacter phage AM24]|nr:hypothetical protein AM24_006 [Acinetobacter phage AM24]